MDFTDATDRDGSVTIRRIRKVRGYSCKLSPGLLRQAPRQKFQGFLSRGRA